MTESDGGRNLTMLGTYLQFMAKAAAHAVQHDAKFTPMLAPLYSTVLSGEVPVSELQSRGIRVMPWTVNEPEAMRELFRIGVDAIISDRPDLLRRVLQEERSNSAVSAGLRSSFEISGHRGARGLRPENTLPSFEAALDNLVDTIETDVGITADRLPLLWHEPFVDPRSCRSADGSPYSIENSVYIRDLELKQLQSMFVCDELRFGENQSNKLSLSPVSVAFAAQERLMSPYSPVELVQLFRFASFYADYYSSGPGRSAAGASARAFAAEKVGFNVEAKILPDNPGNMAADLDYPLESRTVPVDTFVGALCGTIERHGMQARVRVLSFDFRVLLLVQERYPQIPTCYLTGNSVALSTGLVPAELRGL